MALSSVTSPAPNLVLTAPSRVIAEPLGGSREVFYYLVNFPDDIYTKSPDTNLYALMRTILGDAGLNLLSKQFYNARAQTEEMSLDVTALDNFFSNPFGISRSSTESYTPPTGLVTSQVEQQMRSSDSSYFSRAVNYINGARAGNTPLGMQLVSEAGLGYGAEIIENYQYLYDQNSDNPLGLPYYGQTLSPNEFIVLPQPEISPVETLVITIQGNVTGGTLNFGFGRGNQPSAVPQGDPSWTTQSTTEAVSAYVDNASLATAISNLQGVGAGNVQVVGQPGGPYYINFQGAIDVDSIQLLNVYNNLTGTNVTVFVDTLYGEIAANQQVFNVPSADIYTLFSALDNIRPVNTFVNLYPNSGVFQNVIWNSVTGTSEYSEAIRFVTGLASITWPTYPANQFWIQPSVEVQAPRIYKDIYYNYQGWHNVNDITASTTGTAAIQTTTPYNNQLLQTFGPMQALADYAEPLFVTSSVDTGTDLNLYINRIYPIEYENIPGAPTITYQQEAWVSQPGTGQDWLLIELGTPQAVNYITFDIVQDPIQVDIFYDTQDNITSSQLVQVTPIQPYANVLASTVTSSNLASLALTFSNSLGQMTFARRYQLLFTRLNGYTGSIQVQNLRLGRNTAS